ncbi:MAG: c-type cytochrome [Candidatus Kryptoniota bacterium]
MDNKERRDLFLVKKVWLTPLFYIYFTVIVIAIGLIYVTNLTRINRNSVRPDIAVDSSYSMNPFEPAVSEKSVSSSAPTNLNLILAPTPEMINRGKTLFVTNCATCHGSNGEGDGPAAATLNPRPRNFHQQTNWVNGPTLSGMFKTLTQGIPGSAMVSYSVLPVSDRIDLIAYIRTFSTDFPKISIDEVRAVEKEYNLSGNKAGSTPFVTMPVSEAMKMINESGIARVRKIDEIGAYLSAHEGEEGAKIFHSVVQNEYRAITFLLDSNFWSKDLNFFVLLVTANAVHNGFDPKAAQLTVGQWQVMYDFLKGAYGFVSRENNIAGK